MTAKFVLIVLAGIIGNGLGAWNIRTISQGRYLATAVLTFCAATINMTVVRQIAREVSGIYILAFAMGSTLGITSSIFVDKKFSKWLLARKKQPHARIVSGSPYLIPWAGRDVRGHVYPWVED